MAQLLHQKTGKLLELTDTTIISSEWMQALGIQSRGVSPVHARIVRQGDIFYLECIAGDTIYNGIPQTPETRIQVDHNGVLMFGARGKEAIFIFKNEAQQQRLNDTKRIRMTSTSFERVKEAAEQLAKEFYAQCPTQLSIFSRYLIDFMVKKFKVQRGVLYKVEGDGKRWVPLFARSTGAKFTPPRSLLDRVFKTHEPERFSVTEVDDSTELSMSIVNNRVYSAICFPFHHGEELIGILYVDTQDEKVNLTSQDLSVLCTILPGVATLFKVLIDTDKDRIEAAKILGSFCVNNSTKRLDVKLVNKSVSSFSFATRYKDDDLLVLASIIPKNPMERDTAIQVAGYSGLFSTIELCARQGIIEKLYDEASLFMNERFLPYRVSILIGLLRPHGKLDVWGCGGAMLIVKSENRVAFKREFSHELRIKDKKDEAGYDLSQGNKVFFTLDSSERACEFFDKKLDEKQDSFITNFSGGLYFKILSLEK